MSTDPHATGSQSTTDKVKDAAREQADKAMNSDAVKEAKKGLEDLKKQASGQAREHVDAARERLHGHAEERRGRLAENLKGVASGLDAAASEIRDKPETAAWQADGIARLSSVAKDASDYLENHDSKELLADAGEYARAHPMATIGAAMLLGVVGARLLKASKERDHGSSSVGSGSTVAGRSGSVGTGTTSGSGSGTAAGGSSASGPLDPVAAHGTMSPSAPGPSTPAAVPPPPSRSFEASAPPPTGV